MQGRQRCRSVFVAGFPVGILSSARAPRVFSGETVAESVYPQASAKIVTPSVILRPIQECRGHGRIGEMFSFSRVERATCCHLQPF